MSYIPTTEQIAHAYCDGLSGTSRTYEESQGEFDRWLNQVKAEAWTEGFDRGFYRGQILHGDYDASEAGIENPYEVG